MGCHFDRFSVHLFVVSALLASRWFRSSVFPPVTVPTSPSRAILSPCTTPVPSLPTERSLTARASPVVAPSRLLLVSAVSFRAGTRVSPSSALERGPSSPSTERRPKLPTLIWSPPFLSSQSNPNFNLLDL